MADRVRRRHSRAPIQGDVWILIEGAGDWGCELRDISIGGALVECDHPPQLGNTVRVAFDVNGTRILVQCRVVHGSRLSPPPEARYRIGVEFGPLSLREVKLIGDHVQETLA